MAYHVIISDDLGDHEYKHTQRIIAMRQYKTYCNKPETISVTVIHRTRKLDDVIAAWDNPFSHRNITNS